jgi:hypothetical protein
MPRPFLIFGAIRTKLYNEAINGVKENQNEMSVFHPAVNATIE